MLQDFFPTEFRVNPQPDNVVAVTQTSPFYTLTAYSRFQLNTFIETTERLPEMALDIKRHGLFGGPIFYEGETKRGQLRLEFSGGLDLSRITAPFGSIVSTSSTYPNTYFGWLSLVPRVGFRETYYSQTRILSPLLFPNPPDPLAPEFPFPSPQTGIPNPTTGAAFRSIFNAGLEGSFKLSREWNQVQNRALGLDGFVTSFSRSPIFPTSRPRTSIPRPFSSSIAFRPPPNSTRSISRNTPRSIRSITGRSRASACATASKPGGTT